MAGVVRELEAIPAINKFLGTVQARRNQRLRQAIGVLVRMIMEGRGWKKTGKKGSLGVRSSKLPETPSHNTGGLAFWFVRRRRYVQGNKANHLRPCVSVAASSKAGLVQVSPAPTGHTGNGSVHEGATSAHFLVAFPTPSVAPASNLMKAFRVWVRPMDYEYLVCVDGMDNARWLLDQLGRSFVFRSTEWIERRGELSRLCTFKFPATDC